jgi:hypothetical protein
MTSLEFFQQKRIQILTPHYESVKVEEEILPWIVEVEFGIHKPMNPNWDVIKNFPMLDHAYRNLIRTCCLLPNLKKEFPILNAIDVPDERNYNKLSDGMISNILKLKPFIDEKDREQIYVDIIQKKYSTYYYRWNNSEDDFQELWKTRALPLIPIEYHFLIGPLKYLYWSNLNDSDTSLLRSPFSLSKSYADSDSYYGKRWYCLEGRVIAMKIDPKTLEPKIFDKIIFSPEDTDLVKFLDF